MIDRFGRLIGDPTMPTAEDELKADRFGPGAGGRGGISFSLVVVCDTLLDVN